MRIGIFSLLGILFVALKLTSVIDWSWWLVTGPFWVGSLLFVAIIGLNEYFRDPWSRI